MNKGWTNEQICHKIGVNPSTRIRWRFGRRMTDPRTGVMKSYPPLIPTQKRNKLVISNRFLPEGERALIADHRRAGASIRQIAAALNRSPSTVSRELRQNGNVSGRYTPHDAQQQAARRRARPKLSKIARYPALYEAVRERLLTRWSPKQIAYDLRRRFPEQPEFHLVHESIYQALYQHESSGLAKDLCLRLRRKRDRRYPHRGRRPRQGRFVRPKLMITDRPFDSGDRSIPGHWEGDLIIGAGNKSAIITLVERASRYVLLARMRGRGNSDQLRDRLVAVFKALPPVMAKSLTWDQGVEMARHEDFTALTGIPVFFCHPHSPWERGSNENTNGLLRDYFPKSTNLSRHAPSRLITVASELNRRPRETMNWNTPAEQYNRLLATAI